MRRITAIVCTRNRAHRLGTALDSLCRQSIPAEQYDIVVADNASSDDTAAVVRRFATRYGNVRYLFVDGVGSSGARNAALRVADSAYVAFMDDDAVADRCWLEELLRAFATVSPAPVCVGGRILPRWEAAKPPWFPDKYVSSLSVFDLGERGRFLSEREYAVGANLAYLRSALVAAGAYEDRLKLYMDEVYVQMKLRRRGHAVYYHPDAMVQHVVPEARLTRAYLRRRKYLGGRGELIVRQLGRGGWAGYGAAVVNAVGRPVMMAYLTAAWLWHEAVLDERRALESQVLLWRSTGMFVEALRSIAGRNGFSA